MLVTFKHIGRPLTFTLYSRFQRKSLFSLTHAPAAVEAMETGGRRTSAPQAGRVLRALRRPHLKNRTSAVARIRTDPSPSTAHGWRWRRRRSEERRVSGAPRRRRAWSRCCRAACRTSCARHRVRLGAPTKGRRSIVNQKATERSGRHGAAGQRRGQLTSWDWATPPQMKTVTHDPRPNQTRP